MKKNKIIENLRNEKNEIIKKNDEISKKYSEINEKELKENLIQNKKYFDYYEENRIIAQEHINKLNKIINELNNENQKIKEE